MLKWCTRYSVRSFHRYNSTDTGSERTIPVHSELHSTVPYPASPAEPLGTLTDRTMLLLRSVVHRGMSMTQGSHSNTVTHMS